MTRTNRGNLMTKLSMVDVPLSEKIEDFSKYDTLGTKKYADSLAKFVRQCDTPLTVGVQGEWGSGKTSILNIIRSLIHHSNEDVRVSRQKTESVRGAEVFKTIWIDTWEHSLLKKPEECLLSIVEEIIDEITKIDGKFKTAQKAKSAIATLAKGAIRIGTSAALGTHAGSVADDLLSNDTSNGIRALRNALDKAVKDIVETEENHINRFIIFVDDLDRLEPSIAIKVLELLKNIFNVEHCVFILAIDYQVVVKGLKDKFGEPNEKNEWEFRAFFDKIIQLPFMMPTAQYNLGEYIYNMLVKEVEYFDPKVEAKAISQKTLENIVRTSIGRNPRSMKRLVNSVSLIKMQNLDELSEGKKNALILKQLVFTLVCLQISFPKVYELLITESDFGTWDEVFSRRFINSSKLFSEAERALLEIKKSFPDDFDDEWEMALFRIIWAKNWQRDRVVEISRLLSIILDEGIFRDEHDEDFIKKTMAQAVKMTAVTSVSATDDILAGQNDDKHDEAEKNRGRSIYWDNLLKGAKGSKCTFDPEINKFPDKYYASNLTRPISFTAELSITATTGSTTPFKIGQQHKCSDEAFENVFEKLKADQDKIEEIVGTTVKINGEGSRQNMAFDPPKGVKKYVTLHNDKKVADKIQRWMIQVLPKLEEFLQSKLNQEDNL